MKMLPVMLLALILLAAGCARGPEAPLSADAPASTSDAGGAAVPVEEAAPADFSNITVSVRRNAETVSARAITGQAEALLVQEIVFDYMVKSAAWEGVEVSELEDCITLSFDSAGSADRQSYYQYESEGRNVLQAGEAGMYSIMSDGAYEKLMQLAGLLAPS